MVDVVDVVELVDIVVVPDMVDADDPEPPPVPDADVGPVNSSQPATTPHPSTARSAPTLREVMAPV